MARIDRIRVYPVKGFDGAEVEQSEVLSGGTLAGDREFALFDADGDVFNAKRSDRFHRLSTTYDPETTTFRVEGHDGRTHEFDLGSDAGRERATSWLEEYFDADLTLRRDRSTGFVDRREMGPSVVSTATLEAVASWFDDLTVHSVRRRLRANVEVSGVPAFWEDRLVGEGAPSLVADGVRLHGVTPCGRCVVPSRDPDTGEPFPEFRRRFVAKRRETFPDWADEDAFDHFYSLMVITRIPDPDRGSVMRVGDDVALED